MRENDRHVREIDGHVIDVHRVAVLQPHASASGHSGADAAVARVKDDRQARFGDHFIKWINRAIVRLKLLQWRMELESSRAGLNQAPYLGYGFGAARRVNAGEGNHDVRVFGRESQDFVVWNHRSSG